MKKIITLALCLFVVACGSLPKHAETTEDPASAILLVGVPEGSELRIDGKFAGVASKKKKLNRFPVAAGRHSVEIYSAGALVYQREIFIDKGTTREVSVGP